MSEVKENEIHIATILGTKVCLKKEAMEILIKEVPDKKKRKKYLDEIIKAMIPTCIEMEEEE